MPRDVTPVSHACQDFDTCFRNEVNRKPIRNRSAHASDSGAMDEREVLTRLRGLEIETPSWGYGNSGTRFHVYPWPGAARDARERIEDAALVHRLTGCCPTVALHIPWDAVDDYAELRRYTEERGLRIGAINPNLFGDDAYRLGSLCHPDAAVRTRALRHCRECIDIAQEVGSTALSLWLADGTNYPGQDDLRDRHARLLGGLEEIYEALPAGMRLLVEYKFFEPGFYSTDLPDWGTAALACRRLGTQAQVLVDTGHHPQGTNVEQIVAVLLAENLLGGFHFNNRKYADDDLMAGSIDPFELFRIMREIARAEAPEHIAFMIDQSHNVEGKIDAMIQSVSNIQAAYAKALLVDEHRLLTAQREGDVLGAHRVLMEAYETDVRPLLASLRGELGVDPDPVDAFRRGGYAERLAGERGIASVESAYERT
jgi:L-rhamnose isomerase / sugar isomerase